MIAIYTTIAQHPKGFDLHIQNLQWTFSDFPHKIFVQTFKEYGFKCADGVEIIAYDGDSRAYFRFYDHINIDQGDIVVLVQQDNIFSRKVAPLVEECVSGNVLTWDQGNYYSIYDQCRNRIYPRIGEISTFLQRELIEEFKSHALSFGSRGENFRRSGSLYRKYQHRIDNKLIHINPSLAPPDGFERLAACCDREKNDTLFEPFMYCFCLDIPVTLFGSDAVLHFQNPERFHRELPETYVSPHKLLTATDQLTVKIRRYIPSVALMYLLSGVYRQEEAVAKALKMGGQSFKSEIDRLSRTAGHWMNQEQLDKLHWAGLLEFPSSGL